MSVAYDAYSSPIGTLYAAVDEFGVCKLAMTDEEWLEDQKGFTEIRHDPNRCAFVIRQLDEYFKGKRREFNLPLSISGTDFRKKVWQALQQIPYGSVKSYADIANAIGNPKAVRAVGQANRANPLPILIPCHRVIGKSGDLVGYAGNRTDLKTFLLQLEGAIRMI